MIRSPPLSWSVYSCSGWNPCWTSGLPRLHDFASDVKAFPSGRITALSTVVLQWAWSTAAAMRPLYTGDAVHIKASLNSENNTSCTTYQTFCAWCSAVLTFLKTSITSASANSISRCGKLIWRPLGAFGRAGSASLKRHFSTSSLACLCSVPSSPP